MKGSQPTFGFQTNRRDFFEGENTMKAIVALAVTGALFAAAAATPAAAENKCTNSYGCSISTTPGPNGQPQPTVTCTYTRTCK
jgi:hypothetical protein